MTPFVPTQFAPSKPQKVLISLRLDEQMLDKIDSTSVKYDMSRNEFICQCIKFAFEPLTNSNNK